MALVMGHCGCEWIPSWRKGVVLGKHEACYLARVGFGASCLARHETRDIHTAVYPAARAWQGTRHSPFTRQCIRMHVLAIGVVVPPTQRPGWQVGRGVGQLGSTPRARSQRQQLHRVAWMRRGLSVHSVEIAHVHCLAHAHSTGASPLNKACSASSLSTVFFPPLFQESLSLPSLPVFLSRCLCPMHSSVFVSLCHSVSLSLCFSHTTSRVVCVAPPPLLSTSLSLLPLSPSLSLSLSLSPRYHLRTEEGSDAPSLYRALNVAMVTFHKASPVENMQRI